MNGSLSIPKFKRNVPETLTATFRLTDIQQREVDINGGIFPSALNLCSRNIALQPLDLGGYFTNLRDDK